MRFDRGYSEELTLRDGTRLRFRMLRPEDKELLREGLRSLSSLSQYRRFLSPHPELTSEELRYLTELDLVNHFAVAAATVAPGGKETGAGVARAVRLPSDPHLADLAITVVDALQGRGIGKLLLERLSAAAVERGIERFRFDVLASNAPMMRLVRRLWPAARITPRGSTVTVETSLRREPAPCSKSAT